MKEIYEAPILELIEYQTEEKVTVLISDTTGDNDILNPWSIF